MLLISSVLIPFYYTTVGQAVAAMPPTVEAAVLLFTSTFSLVLILRVFPLLIRFLRWLTEL